MELPILCVIIADFPRFFTHCPRHFRKPAVSGWAFLYFKNVLKFCFEQCFSLVVKVVEHFEVEQNVFWNVVFFFIMFLICHAFRGKSAIMTQSIGKEFTLNLSEV